MPARPAKQVMRPPVDEDEACAARSSTSGSEKERATGLASPCVLMGRDEWLDQDAGVGLQ